MSISQLCEGVCNASTLGRFENNEVSVNLYHPEVIMQRLGRSVDRYFNIFTGFDDFYEMQRRDEIGSLLAIRRHEEAAGVLSVLESKKSYQKVTSSLILCLRGTKFWEYLLWYFSKMTARMLL